VFEKLPEGSEIYKTVNNYKVNIQERTETMEPAPKRANVPVPITLAFDNSA
jgi:hypothetical protein